MDSIQRSAPWSSPVVSIVFRQLYYLNNSILAVTTTANDGQSKSAARGLPTLAI